MATLKRGTNRYEKKVDGQNCPSTSDEGMSIKQAAEKMGVSERLVKSAKKTMRDDPAAHEAASAPNAAAESGRRRSSSSRHISNTAGGPLCDRESTGPATELL